MLMARSDRQPLATADAIRFDPVVARRFVACARAIGWLVVLASLAVLVGWLSAAAALRALVQPAASVHADAAAVALLAGAALVLGARAPRVSLALSLLVLLAGALELAAYAFALPRSDPQWPAALLAPWPQRPPARMTELAALGFVLLGVVGATVVLRRAVWLRDACALVVIAVAMAAGAAYGLVLAGDSAGLLRRLPITTALLLLLLALGWMASAPANGLIRVAVTDSVGGAFARRLILPALLLPLVATFALKMVQAWLGISESLALALAAVAGGGTVAVMIVWVAFLLDRGERQRRAVLALRADASTDALTGLANRRSFDAALAAAVQEQRAATLLLLDVDHFKRFNDSFGHPAGDDVLRQTARLLQAAVRAQDLVARYGGEEFAILLPQSDALRARHVAQRIVATVRAHPWPQRPITVSIGVALAMPGDTAAALLQRADAALYRSKQDGRSRFSFDPVQHDEAPPPARLHG